MLSGSQQLETVVTYVVSTACVIAVNCKTQGEADAVSQFAKEQGFTSPAPERAKPVHHCNATTHPNGEVLWG